MRWAKLILIIILIINFSVRADAASLTETEAQIKIAAAGPWLAVITSFIGGPNVSVTSLYDFNAKPNKNLNLNNINKIIAIDRDELKNFKINLQASRLTPTDIETWYLFKEFKELNNLEAAILDPSVTPFIAQKIMTALSTWDAANYPYYQRRLAEFQTRLSSSILAGKQLLNGTKIYLDGEGALNLYNLFKASGCEILDQVTPEALSIVDDSSYVRGKRKVKSQGNIFYFKRPEIKDNNYNIDYPAYLHDLYIALWQLISKAN